MKLRFFGGLVAGDGSAVVAGRGQQALLLRLAVDTATTVGYRALTEDIWGQDPPADPRASLHSLASRLRRALPQDALVAAPGGYRLAFSREDIDITRFADLVARARAAADPGDAASLAREALSLWNGDPWTPGDGFDWLVRDLLEDRAHAERLAGARTVVADDVVRESAGDVFRESTVPAAITSLVGREAELALIEQQLASERLVTVVGPGGAGKTTLAFETARLRAGAIIVELAPVAAGDVWSALAGAVGRSVRLPDATSTPIGVRDGVVEALTGRRVLIVLDNCEHVSREAAEVAVDVLQALPESRVLATSREPLGVPGEAFVDLGPLPLPDAVELFGLRARAASGSVPDPADAATIEGIVRRLDGLPLAVELAAAKTRTLSLIEIAAGLDDRFRLLAAGPRATAPRHQTLRALIDWSWDTLTPTERTALLAAAVFPDGIAATDAAVIGARYDLPASAFDELVDRSLLSRRHGRFRMLETVREYGLERLRAEGLDDRFRASQAESMAELASARDATLRGPQVRAGLAWFDTNEENLSSALRFCAETARRSTGVRLVRAMLWPWILRERTADLAGNAAVFAATGGALDSEPEVVVAGVGLLADSFSLVMDSAVLAPTAGGRGDVPRYDERAAEIAAASAQHPSELAAALPALLRGIAEAMSNLGRDLSWSHGVTFAEGPTDHLPPWTRAFLGVLRAGAAANSGDVETLGAQSALALRTFSEIGDPWGIAFAGQLQSEWLMLEGRLEEALEIADRSTDVFSGLTSASDAVQQRSQTVGLLVRLGRVDDARSRVDELDDFARQDGSERALVQVRMSRALVEIAAGDAEAALRELAVLDRGLPAGFPSQLTAWWGSKRAQALTLLHRTDEARAALRDAVPVAIRSGDQPIMADVALSLAGWLVETGQDAAARRALATASALRGSADEHDPYRTRLVARMAAAPEEPVPDAAAEFIRLAALLDDDAV
ncbi:ATPase [Microbacterium sp. Gd 4-13]|uniref:ATP-binding protein n=1 Tax=Microbacterium sp. Gd 4-13 TaxID=2173179 RepID=UPI000D56BA72|nr:ATPase [Microbacterium sp. Gd 4-13]PVW03977.1 ATPase [Microbacterium sp. Gd 4-13]